MALLQSAVKLRQRQGISSNTSSKDLKLAVVKKQIVDLFFIRIKLFALGVEFSWND